MEFHIRCTTCDAINRTDTTLKGGTISCMGCSDTVELPRKTISPGLVLSDRYLLIEELGGGGFANVWKARQLSTDRNVALKILKQSYQEEFVERFQQEIRLVAQIEHPLIVTAFDAGEDTGLHYLVMSYVPGQNLHELVVQEGPLPESEALKVTGQIAEAMELAWNKFEMVHRDIKPANLMITPERTIRLLDLGIARANLENNPRLTPTDGMIGSVSTMSPEQIERPTEVTCQSDLYAVGCTLYFLLTGRFPFHAKTQLKIINQHLNEEPVDPRTHEPAISEPTAQLVLTLLHKEPEKRPAGWDGLRRLLPGGVSLDQTINVAPLTRNQPEPKQRLGPPPRRGVLLWLLTALLGCALLLGCFYAWQNDILFRASPDPWVPMPVPDPLPPLQPPAPPAVAKRSKLFPPVALAREPERVVMPDFTSMATNKWPAKITWTITDDQFRLVELPMNLVQPGTFTMGRSNVERQSLPDWSELVSTQHEVTITRPFYLALTELTLEQWSIITQYKMPMPDQRHRPAFSLMWKEAGDNDYFKGKHDNNLQARLHERYEHRLPAGYEFRLPTEAEWEYACRAGSDTTYPFGDDPAALGEYAQFQNQMTIEVASLKPNAWGFYDMLGNCSEWVIDGYTAYPRDGSPRTDPVFTRDGALPGGIELRMLRGGAYLSPDPLDCSPGHRLPIEYYKREARIGFRLAVAPIIEVKRSR